MVAVLVLMLASRDRVRDRGMSTISPACNTTNSVNNSHNNITTATLLGQRCTVTSLESVF